MTRRTRALLLSGLVLPGLGQLYLGRVARGIVLLLLVNLLLLLSLVLLLRGAAPLVAASLASGKMEITELLKGFEGATGYGRALLGGFWLLWLSSVVDILVGREGRREGESV